MRKLVFILSCVVGIMCLSSCRSTSASCGLADTAPVDQAIVLQKVNLNQLKMPEYQICNMDFYSNYTLEK